jgi:hypothetical protein
MAVGKTIIVSGQQPLLMSLKMNASMILVVMAVATESAGEPPEEEQLFQENPGVGPVVKIIVRTRPQTET